MKSPLTTVVVVAVTFSIQAYTLMQMNQIQGRLQQISAVLPAANIKVLKAKPSLDEADGMARPLPAGEAGRESLRM